MLRRRTALSTITLAITVSIAVLATACGGSSTTSPSTTISERNDTPGTWTVLVYMAADNNLEAAAYRDIQQMKQTSGTDFVVLLDRTPGYSNASMFGLGDFADAAMVHIRDGRVELLDRLGEVDTGDPATLSDFIDVGLAKYRNDKNALVIWDHGGSWRGSAWDDTADGSNLSLAETAVAMDRGLASAGLDRFDLVGFDACLMATYEVASAMAPHAEVLVASEELEPGSGWNWASLSTPTEGLTITEMADAILDGYLEETAAAGETLVTLSALDLRRLEPLDRATRALAASMSTDVRDAIGRVGYARSRSVAFGRSPDPESDYWSVDIGSLSTELEHVDGLADIATDLHDAVHEVVLRRVDGAPLARAGGIAGYFPPVESLYSDDYDAADLAPAWLEMLRAYYAATRAVPESALPSFELSGALLPASSVIADADSIELLAKVRAGTGGNVIDAIVQWGLPNAFGGVSWFGQMNAGIAGDTISGGYSWDQLILSDGIRSVMAYASLDVDAHGELTSITIPIALVRGEESAQGSIQITVARGEATAQTIYVETDSAISAIEVEPGDVIVPLLLQQQFNGTSRWTPTPGGGILADPATLTMDYGALPPSTEVQIRLVILDVDGGSDRVAYLTTTP